MASKDWPRAIRYLEKLEARYPYGRFAQQAQLEIAYCHWKDDERASAVAAVDRFIKLYPEPSQRRLRLVPEGADQLQRPVRHVLGDGHART